MFPHELRREEESEARWLEWSFSSGTVPLFGKEVPKNKLSPLCLIGNQSVFLSANLAAVDLERRAAVCLGWVCVFLVGRGERLHREVCRKAVL